MPAPTTSHTVTLSINGTDRTSLLLRDSLYIRHSLSNLASVCDFQIKSSASYTPLGWHQASITINGQVVFGGFIVNNDASTVGAGSTRQTNWQISCQDWSILLDRIIVSEKYTQAADYNIISDLFSTYLASENFFYTDGVISVKTDIDISFDRISMRDALNQLAERCNAAWFIDPSQQFYWNKKTGFGAATFTIDTDSPNNITTFDVAYNSLRRQIDDSNIINKVTVVGGLTDSGAKQTDTFTGDGSKDTFGPLTKDVNSMWAITFTSGSTSYSTYATNIGYEPQDKLAYEGGTYVALVNLENRTVRIRTASGGVPDNATSVSVTYYYGVPVETSAEHTGSQAYYGRVFEKKVYDDTLTSIQAATDYAERTINQYAFQRETVQFDTYKHGLLPGTLMQIQCAALGLTNTRTLEGINYESNLAQTYSDNDFTLLLESGDAMAQEGYGSNAVYIIQEVQIQPKVSAQGLFMMVARVTCGDRQHTIQDAIKRATGGSLSAGNGKIQPQTQYGRVSTISNNLGEVISGRALFTDGGVSKFSWNDYGGHTGVVVGLDDSGAGAYGVVNILSGGTIRAKLGKMDGLPTVGTITPTGWGLYTDNGYFSGNVVGGTISGAVGNIGGFVIQANQMYSNGGTISTGSVINSSNPGVYMGTAGLFGYGTLGLTFAIYSDPGRSPWFSSGTINNVVYEVYESAIIRTTSDVFVDGGVQIDNSGIFGVDPTTGGARMETEADNFLFTEDGRTLAVGGVSFMLDATTGNMWAENAFLSGTVYAQSGVFTGTVYASDGSFTGTVSAAQVSGGTVTGALISGNNITASIVSGGTVSGALVSGGTVTGGLISGGTVSGSYISGGSADFVGGSVQIHPTQGINFRVSDGFSTSTTPSFVRWKNNSDRTYTYMGAYSNGAIANGSAIFAIRTATTGGDDYGAINLLSQKWVSNSVRDTTEAWLQPGWFYLNVDGVTSYTGAGNAGDLNVLPGSILINNNLLPVYNNDISLGTPNYAYTALYLSDGTDEWKITINSSGVLQTVKV